MLKTFQRSRMIANEHFLPSIALSSYLNTGFSAVTNAAKNKTTEQQQKMHEIQVSRAQQRPTLLHRHQQRHFVMFHRSTDWRPLCVQNSCQSHPTLG